MPLFVDVDSAKFIEEPNIDTPEDLGETHTVCVISATQNGEPMQIYVPATVLSEILTGIFKTIPETKEPM